MIRTLLTFFLGLACAACAACAGEDSAPRALPGERASDVAASQLSRADATPEIPVDAPLVAFLGDSIAAGLHLSADEAFPAVLQRELAGEGLPFRLINAGVSGDTTAGGLRRIDWLLSREPALVVIELGGNDGLRGQDVAEVEKNLRGIVRKAQDSGAKLLLLGVRLPPNLGADYVRRFEQIYENIAVDGDLPLVRAFMSGVGGVPEMNLEDGLHPTTEGHRRIARNVLPVLREILNELAAR